MVLMSEQTDQCTRERDKKQSSVATLFPQTLKQIKLVGKGWAIQ